MPSRDRSELAVHGALAALLLAGCSADAYERQADRAVAEILGERTDRVLGGREANAARPREKAIAAPPLQVVPGNGAHDAERVGAAPPEPAPTRVLALRDALEIAIRSNRGYVSEREALYLAALSLTGTQYAFSPRVAATLSYLFAGSDSGPESHTAGLDASLTKTLPWGGEASLNAASGYAGHDGYSSSVGIRLTQPLLRGAGREVALEALTAAERGLVYAIRDFELFREEFSIDVASRYYNLVQQKQAVDNQRRNLDGFVFGRKQAEALYSVGRTNELEVLRARRSELTSQNSLLEAEESYRLVLDRFRIFLGLPDSERIEVLGEEPSFVPVDYDVASAVEVALRNRLDWLNRQEQLEDVQRGVRIARNGLLPDLSLSANYTLAADTDTSFVGQGLDEGSYGAGLTLSLPVQQVNERNAYRSAQIGLSRAVRALEEFKDDLVVSVRSTFRELERRKQSLEIQAQLIADQERNVKIAQLRFEQGNFSNRDVVEAQQALLEASNSLIREKVSYEIARLQLLKDLGILFIDEKGMWKE